MTSPEPSAEPDTAALGRALSTLDPKFDRPGAIGLEIADGVLQFRLWESVETGDIDYRSVSVGNRIYVSDQPERRLESGPTFPTANALLSYLKPDAADPFPDSSTRPTEDHDSYEERTRRGIAQNWPQPLQDTITEHADRLAEETTDLLRHRPPLTERTCSGCAGTGHVLGRCPCVYLGPPKIVNLDAATREPAGPYEPSQDCTTCAGTGHSQRHCYDCGGTGVLAGPIPTTLTLAGGGPVVIDGQPAALAHRTPVVARCDFTPTEVTVSWSLDSKAIADQGLRAAGLDPLRIVVRNSAQEVEVPQWIAGTCTFRAHVKNGRIDPDPPSGASLTQDAEDDGLRWSAMLPTAEHIAADIETGLLAGYRSLLPGTLSPNRRDGIAASIGVTLDERGVPVSRALSVEPMPTIGQLLIDVAKAAATRGLHAALTMSFIATGEWGPAVILLDADLTPVAKGDTSYTIGHALLSALDRL